MVNLTSHPFSMEHPVKENEPNFDSVKDFIKTLPCLMLMKFNHLERIESVLLAFLHNKDTSNFSLLLSQIISSPIWAHFVLYYNKVTRTPGNIQDRECWNNSQQSLTIQLVADYFWKGLHLRCFRKFCLCFCIIISKPFNC